MFCLRVTVTTNRIHAYESSGEFVSENIVVSAYTLVGGGAHVCNRRKARVLFSGAVLV